MNTASIDRWMAFYGDEFFRAVKPHPKEIGMMYLLAIWYYRINKCKGLINDDELLRNICECERESWPKAKQIIFDDDLFFRKENGLWHQKRARKEYHVALDRMKKNQSKTRAASEARWKK